MDNPIKYNSGITSVLKKLNLNLSINNESVVLLNQILNQVNYKLINHCHSKFKDEINGVDFAHHAVEEIFPGELKNNAKAECHKNIFLFYNGLLEYKPKNPITYTKVFNSGIRKLQSAIFPAGKVDQNATFIINDFLDDLFKQAAEKASKSGHSKNKIEVNDFQEAIKSFLPTEIQRHAHYEGSRKVFDHDSHSFTFIPGTKFGTFTRAVVPKRQKNLVAMSSRKRPSITTDKASKSLKLPKKPIKYSHGIKQIAQEVHGKWALNRLATAFLNHIANELNYKLIDHCNHSTQNLPENGIITLRTAEDAVRDLYPGELLPHAVVEANKDVFMLRNGMIKYKPKKFRLNEEQKKIKQMKTVFPKGLQSLISNAIPNATLTAKSRTLMENILQNLSTKICNEARLLMKNQNKLEYSDINSALEKVLPKEMHHFAHAEAARFLLKYDTGSVAFTPHSMKNKERGQSKNRIYLKHQADNRSKRIVYYKI